MPPPEPPLDEEDEEDSFLPESLACPVFDAVALLGSNAARVSNLAPPLSLPPLSLSCFGNGSA